MVTMPRTKKPAGTAVDRRNGRRGDLALGPTIEVELPRDRHTFQPLSLTVWDGYWSQPVAATVTEADLMVVWTWIEAFDDALTKRAEADMEPLTKGSMGQMIANPLYQVAAQREAVALQCAKQLGIGGRNRADLGLALFTAAQAQASPAVVDDGDDDEEFEDPRRAAS